MSSFARPRYDDDDYDVSSRRSSSSSSSMMIWIIILSIVGVFGLISCCGCAGAIAWVIAKEDITNTTWRGNETLPGFGPLTFEFKRKNEAIMRDAHGTVKGTWAKDGQRVVIRFANCEYRGNINGNVMTGSAHGAQMMRGQNWTFTVTRD